MRKLILSAGAAALAIAAPATAERGGKGGGEKGSHAAHAKAGAEGAARAQKAERPREQQARAAKVERRGGQLRSGNLHAQREDKRKNVEVRQSGKAKQARVRVEDRKVQRVARVEHRKVQRVARVERREGDRNRIVLDRRGDRDRLAMRDRDRNVVRVRDFDRRFERRFANRGLPAGFVGGCPPGLAKKEPACIPPGQAKEYVGRRLPAVYTQRVLPVALRNIYRDTDDYYYRWGDGYAYRVRRDNDLVAALLPLVGAGFGVGQPFGYAGPSYYVPSYYQPFYMDTDDDYYRYANGYVYEIDRSSGMIEDIIPLLDRGYGVGQILPTSYSYYNVPYQYRSLYYDTPDYAYRYAPGVIYQVDRDTSLITAIASLLTGGLTVGQPLPSTYGVYNVPLSYRDRYYDTPDAWYRYSDGYIYQVDPRTQLITAMVDAIV